MPPVRGVEGRKPHQPVHALLRAQIAIRIFPSTAMVTLFKTGFFSVSTIQDLSLESACIGPAQVHAFQHGGPILRIGSACPGMDGKQGIVIIVQTGQHRGERPFVQIRFERGDFFFQFTAQRLVIQAAKFGQIVQMRLEGTPRFNFSPQIGDPLHGFLRAGRVVPKVRRLHFLFEFDDLFLFACEVKDAPKAGTLIVVHGSNDRVNPA